MMSNSNDEFLNVPGYNPENLLDGLSNFLKLRNDAQLARALGVGAPVICKIRKRTYAVTHRMLIHMHDATGISLDVIREMGGIPKSNLTGKPKKKDSDTETMSEGALEHA